MNHEQPIGVQYTKGFAGIEQDRNAMNGTSTNRRKKALQRRHLLHAGLSCSSASMQGRHHEIFQ